VSAALFEKGRRWIQVKARTWERVRNKNKEGQGAGWDWSLKSEVECYSVRYPVQLKKGKVKQVLLIFTQ
jgi:hypothetical protein